MDERERRAQALLWEIKRLRAAGDLAGAAKKSRRMARLHEAVATERISSGDPDGWVHLQAAVTAFVKTGDQADHDRGMRLLVNGLDRVLYGRTRNTAIADQLFELLSWARAHDPARKIAKEAAATPERRREVA